MDKTILRKFALIAALIGTALAALFIQPTPVMAQGIANVGDFWCGEQEQKESGGLRIYAGTCTKEGWEGRAEKQCAPWPQQPLGTMPECKVSPEYEAQWLSSYENQTCYSGVSYPWKSCHVIPMHNAYDPRVICVIATCNADGQMRAEAHFETISPDELANLLLKYFGH